MQEIACPLCKTTHEEVAIEENGYLGRRCRDCGVIYISPRPTFDELLNLYGHGESHTGSRLFVTAADRLNARQNIRVLNDFVQSGSLLEIGTKTGGIMVFETGNIGELDAEQLKNFDLFQYPDHLFFFGEHSIRELLSQSGFETLEIRGYSIVPQLALISVVLRLRGLVRRLRGKSSAPKAAAPVTAAPAPPPSSSTAKRFLRSAWDYLLHFCKFGIGAVFKRSGTPQTYICAARRQ